MSIFDRIDSKSKDIKQKEVKKKEEKKTSELVLQHIELDMEVDRDTLDYLKEQTIKIHGITTKAYTQLGKVFFETQEQLAKNGYGCFREWFENIGYKKDAVYRLISRHNLIVANCDKQDLIESLPMSLSYEIAKESCPKELRDKVLEGEIKTLKELKEAKGKLLVELKEGPKPAAINITEILKSDLDEFRTNIRSFEKFVSEGIEKVEEDKKERIAKEIEQINKKIEKLLKNI